MSVKQIRGNLSHLAANETLVSEELARLTRKVNQIEQILKFSLTHKREVFSVRSRLLKAVAEKRMTLNFWRKINTKKYLRILKNLNLDC